VSRSAYNAQLEGGSKDWNEVPVRTLFTRVVRKGHENETLLSVYREHGVVPKTSRDDNHNRESEDLSSYQLVEPGDLAVNKMKAWQGSVAVARERGIVSPAYFIYRSTNTEDPKFLHYLLRSGPMASHYQAISKGVRIGQWDLDPDAFAATKLKLPNREQQKRIVEFLDRETARIDMIIEKQEKLIETLRERRAALFDATLIGATNAVGTRFKHFVLGVRQGWSPQCHPWPTDGIEHWAVLKTGCANGGLFRPQENKELPDSEVPRPDTVVQQEEIIVSRANTRELVGSAAVVGGEFPKLMLSDKLYSFQVDKKRALPQFLAAVLGTRRVRDFIELEATGSSPSMLNVSREEILNLPVELPDIQTQHRLWCELSGRREKIDALITKAQKFIKLAKERRSALITAAVTGQIDVTEDGDG